MIDGRYGGFKLIPRKFQAANIYENYDGIITWNVVWQLFLKFTIVAFLKVNSRFLRGRGPWSTQAVVANHHRLSGLKTTQIYCLQSGGWEAQDQGHSRFSVW